ncbi:glycoside hydrolase family 43 protein [Herbivorax sp. ANBcel31]|uniref:glycoside hydrolase family 43 protein n=1 Tax=Herbivorax sp. ANBcel31 TaxID=3069754 RepID=UPI0027B3274C|nr:glycoside hydrolase family 43 protein [Herbivorax sp. ANBcel31]MDQ2086969.1 glycoside hydrolase family 43 protein [Herbivorax sp. ANBcel31]
MANSSKPNQPLVTHIYTADPSAHVFEDKIYIYPSHDLDQVRESNDTGDQYNMEDYHVLSMDSMDSPCVDCGEVLHLKNVPWVKQQMWAPDAAFKNNTYYFYFPAKDKDGIFRLGVATGSSPAGPFKAQENYIPGSFSIDPAVLVDDDDKAYIYFGGLWGGQLEKWQTGKYDSDAEGPAEDEPALGPIVAELSDDMLTFKDKPQEISIVDEDGKPILAGDEERRFFEGPWVHKYKGYYYLSYSTGTTHYIVYAVSKSPTGPFVYKGRILNPVKGWTTHHSIVKFKDKWYLFYHDCSLSDGADNRRCVKYTEIKYNDDGTIQTIDPYK